MGVTYSDYSQQYSQLPPGKKKKKRSNLLDFQVFPSHCESFFGGSNIQSRSASPHTGANTGFSCEHTPQADVLPFSFLLVQLAEDLLCLPFWMPLSLLLFCGNSPVLCMCIFMSMRVHVCACMRVSVGVSGLCSPLSPLGIPLPLTPPLSLALSQQITRSWGFHTECLLSSFPSFIFSLLYFSPFFYPCTPK